MQQKLLKSKDVIILAHARQASFARACAKQSGLRLILLEEQQFASGEYALDLTPLEGLSNTHVLIIHSSAHNVHGSLMWLFFVIHALNIRSISVSIFMPYMAYARQEQTLLAIGHILHALKVQSLTCIELHKPSLAQAMPVPTNNILLHEWIAVFLKERYPVDQLTIVSPDRGAIARAQAIAVHLDVPLIICTKQRDALGVTITDTIGSCSTRYAVIIDDIIDTGATLKDVAHRIRTQNSSCTIDAFAVHGLLSADALSILSSSGLRKLYITNSIEPRQIVCPTVEIVDVIGAITKYLF